MRPRAPKNASDLTVNMRQFPKQEKPCQAHLSASSRPRPLRRPQPPLDPHSHVARHPPQWSEVIETTKNFLISAMKSPNMLQLVHTGEMAGLHAHTWSRTSRHA